MKSQNIFFLTLYAIPLFCKTALPAQNPAEIVKKAEEKARGEQAYGEIKMTIVRPTWQREITMKSWTKGEDYSLVLITSPKRDRGMAFLKRKKELWNWQPNIDRTIKMPPSMMMQPWMGSDLTNDDLMRQSSLVSDFHHKLLGKEKIEGRPCYKIELIPKPETAVVWGKIIIWIDEKDFLQMKAEFYDEDIKLVNTLYAREVKMIAGRILPTRIELVPADKEGHRTVIEQLALDFNLKLEEDFFSIQNLKRVK